jgi:hypothetical protein
VESKWSGLIAHLSPRQWDSTMAYRRSFIESSVGKSLNVHSVAPIAIYSSCALYSPPRKAGSDIGSATCIKPEKIMLCAQRYCSDPRAQYSQFPTVCFMTFAALSINQPISRAKRSMRSCSSVEMRIDAGVNPLRIRVPCS